MKRVLEVTVRPDGSTRVRARGFWGRACVPASRFLEQALGRRLHERRTAEFYQSEPTRQSEHHRTGPPEAGCS